MVVDDIQIVSVEGAANTDGFDAGSFITDELKNIVLVIAEGGKKATLSTVPRKMVVRQASLPEIVGKTLRATLALISPLLSDSQRSTPRRRADR